VISNFPSHIRQEEEFIRPIVQERFARMEEFGDDWDDKPVRRSASLGAHVIINAEKQNDMLMWLISEAKGVERSVEGLVRRFLQVNFAATVSTTPVSYTNLQSPHGPLIAIICSLSRLHCTTFFPTQNILNPSATRSRPRYQRKAGPRPGWIR
jgi:hypothetical protein